MASCVSRFILDPRTGGLKTTNYCDSPCPHLLGWIFIPREGTTQAIRAETETCNPSAILAEWGNKGSKSCTCQWLFLSSCDGSTPGHLWPCFERECFCHSQFLTRFLSGTLRLEWDLQQTQSSVSNKVFLDINLSWLAVWNAEILILHWNNWRT